MVRLARVVEPDMAEVWLKLEGMQPAGSIKDRTALGMILDAEQRGILHPGDTIVEPTSGNTGIGLAQVAAARGYKLILCLPSSMSDERKRTLLAFGAELVLTDPERRMLAAIEEAEKIASETGAWMPNQFANPANPRIHYETTAPELWSQNGRTHRRLRVRIRHRRHDQRCRALSERATPRHARRRGGTGAIAGAVRRRARAASVSGHGTGLRAGELRPHRRRSRDARRGKRTRSRSRDGSRAKRDCSSACRAARSSGRRFRSRASSAPAIASR